MRRQVLLAVVLAAPLAAQRAERKVFYLPRPVSPAPWAAPMKPVVHLADLKAKHYGATNWSELVVADRNSRVEVISAAPGSKMRRHLHPDSPHWWVVHEGRIRFEIEYPEGKFQTIEARKGSYVYAPERHLHSLEVVGSEPAIRMDVTLRDATPVYDTPPEGLAKGEWEMVPVTLDTGLNPLDVPSPGGKPDRIAVTIEELEAAHRNQSAWSEPAMRKNRVRGNFIYGRASDNPKERPGERGHLHADFAEFWTVLRGRLKWRIEGAPEFIASEGDIVYAPPMHFHHIQFVGEGGNCRLTSSTYPSANHFYDAPH